MKVFLAVFLSILMPKATFASEASEAASALKDGLQRVPEIKTVIDESKDKAQRKVKQAIEGNEEIAATSGVILKLIIDGKIDFKGRLDEKTSYKVQIRGNGDFVAGIRVNLKDVKNTNYDLSGYTGGQGSGISAGVNFDLD